MKATILSAALLFPLVATSASANPTWASHDRTARGAVAANLDPALKLLARSQPRRGETLVPIVAPEPGCVVELRTRWVYDTPVRDSRPLCRYSDGSIRPLR